jgi:hypothetical protein
MGRTPSRKNTNNTDRQLCLRDSESQNLFGQIPEQELETFSPHPPYTHPQIKLLQYVDDLLISGTKRKG